MDSTLGNNDKSKGKGNPRMKVTYPVCGKMGHIALHCYDHFDVINIERTKLPSDLGTNVPQTDIGEYHKNNTTLFMSSTPLSALIRHKEYQQ